MEDVPKLIIIRGPSGAGKSTVSKTLLKQSDRKTLLVSEDQIRKMFNDNHLPGHTASKELSVYSVLLGLREGYDVILEGILNIKTSQERLGKILKAHAKENYFFYLDVSYDETLRRHATRPEKAEFSTDAMKEWWDYASPSGQSTEVVIPESSSLKETVASIAASAGLNLKTA